MTSSGTKIHPTAVVDSGAQIGEGVEIGPYAVIESDTVIGEGCRIMGGATIRRYTQMGSGNVVHPYAVLGGEPQDVKFDPASVSYVKIGNNNIFREGCTVNRATGEGKVTIVGNENFFMTCSHAGHNAIVGNNVVLVNGAVIGGFGEVGDRALLSSSVAVHQFCWFGEMVVARGLAASTQHVPPYCMLYEFNVIVGLNRVGLKRAPHISAEDRRQIHEAYRITYRSGLTVPKALERMEVCTDWGSAADKFRRFVRRVLEAQPPYKRGLCGARRAKLAAAQEE